MVETFALIGAVAVVCVVEGLVTLIIDIAKDKYQHKRWKYKYKHRFDKPPTAKCYCIDCVHGVHDDVTNRVKCRYEGAIDDNRFCWRAEPKLFDPEDGE